MVDHGGEEQMFRGICWYQKLKDNVGLSSQYTTDEQEFANSLEV